MVKLHVTKEITLENTDSEQLREALATILLHLRDPKDSTHEERLEEFDVYAGLIHNEDVLTTSAGTEFLRQLYTDVRTYTDWVVAPTPIRAMAAPTMFAYQGPLADEYYKDIYLVGGIDVSKWQAIMDWDTALAQNVSFAFVRISYSYTMRDSEYGRNASELNYRGVPWAGYHFLVPSTDINNAVREANFCMSIMDEYSHGTMSQGGKPVVVLDMETRGALSARSQQLFDYIWKWIDHVEKAGYSVVFYSSRGWLDGNLRQSDVEWLAANFAYWQAQYTTAEEPSLPNHIDENDYWQFNADGNGLGHKYGASGSQSIDLNRYMYTWERFFNEYMSDMPEPPEPPEPPDPNLPSANVTYQVRQSINKLNVREGPGTNNAAIGHLTAGDKVVFEDMGGSSAWLQIKEGKYAGSWVAVDYSGTRYMDKLSEGD